MSDARVKTNLPTAYGDFIIFAFEDSQEGQPHLALVHKNCDTSTTVPVRIHSECLTGDVFKSKRCDCGEQLELSMHYISRHPGILIYLRQEGRGIGLINKLKAYNLQEKGLNTFEANEHLGFEPDERDFDIAIEILTSLGVTSIDLITNNPKKIDIFENSAVKLRKRITLHIEKNDQNKKYLEAKRDVMGHFIHFD